MNLFRCFYIHQIVFVSLKQCFICRRIVRGQNTFFRYLFRLPLAVDVLAHRQLGFESALWLFGIYFAALLVLGRNFCFLIGIRFFTENEPNQSQPMISNKSKQMVTCDVQFHFFPRSPVAFLLKSAVEINSRVAAFCAGKNVHGFDIRLIPGCHDFEKSDIV